MSLSPEPQQRRNAFLPSAQQRRVWHFHKLWSRTDADFLIGYFDE
jgi:hypothetical protein